MDAAFPRPISEGFGLGGHIVAALSMPQYRSRRESVLFFKRGSNIWLLTQCSAQLKNIHTHTHTLLLFSKNICNDNSVAFCSFLDSVVLK